MFHVSAECCSSRSLHSSPQQQEVIDLTAATSAAASDSGMMGDHAAGAPVDTADDQANLAAAAYQLLRVPKLGASANRCTVLLGRKSSITRGGADAAGCTSIMARRY